MKDKRRYRRFSLLGRLQHLILMLSVLMAVVTGMPMKFPDAWWAGWIIETLGGVENRTLLHKYAGLTIVFLGLFHAIYYLLLNWRVPFYKQPILPRLKDADDFWQHMRYNIGLRPELPRMGFYTWFQKFDYLGAIWGVLVMGLTGLAMLYMESAMRYMPLAWLQSLWTMHGDEAMLAAFFPFSVHMYHVHFNRDVFPMSLAWVNGLATRKYMEKYHTLELNPETASGFTTEVEDDTAPPVQSLFDRINAVSATVVSSVGVFVWVVILYFVVYAIA